MSKSLLYITFLSLFLIGPFASLHSKVVSPAQFEKEILDGTIPASQRYKYLNKHQGTLVCNIKNEEVRTILLNDAKQELKNCALQLNETLQTNPTYFSSFIEFVTFKTVRTIAAYQNAQSLIRFLTDEKTAAQIIEEIQKSTPALATAFK